MKECAIIEGNRGRGRGKAVTELRVLGSRPNQTRTNHVIWLLAFSAKASTGRTGKDREGLTEKQLVEPRTSRDVPTPRTIGLQSSGDYATLRPLLLRLGYGYPVSRSTGW